MPDVHVDLGDMGDLWDRRGELGASDFRARQFWASVSDERRKAIALVVAETFARLVEDPQGWLPMACEGEADRVDVVVSIAIPELEAAELARRVDAKKTRHTAVAMLAQLERGLRG